MRELGVQDIEIGDPLSQITWVNKTAEVGFIEVLEFIVYVTRCVSTPNVEKLYATAG